MCDLRTIKINLVVKGRKVGLVVKEKRREIVDSNPSNKKKVNN